MNERNAPPIHLSSTAGGSLPISSLDLIHSWKRDRLFCLWTCLPTCLSIWSIWGFWRLLFCRDYFCFVVLPLLHCRASLTSLCNNSSFERERSNSLSWKGSSSLLQFLPGPTHSGRAAERRPLASAISKKERDMYLRMDIIPSYSEEDK